MIEITIVTDRTIFESIQVNSTLISSKSSEYYPTDHINENCDIGSLASINFEFNTFTYYNDYNLFIITNNLPISLCPLSVYNLTLVTIDTTNSTGLTSNDIFSSSK